MVPKEITEIKIMPKVQLRKEEEFFTMNDHLLREMF